MTWPVLIFLALLFFLACLAVAPPRINTLVSRPRPAASYSEALEPVAALHAQQAAGHNPLCRTQLLTHGDTTEHVIAFVLGSYWQLMIWYWRSATANLFGKAAGPPARHARLCRLVLLRIPSKI